MQDSQQMIEVLKPTGRKCSIIEKSLSGITDLKNSTIGFLDNSKPNFSVFLDRLETLLLSNCHVAKIIRQRKPQPSFPAGILIDELAQKCNLVIAGSGD